jgi:hypothetical protein
MTEITVQLPDDLATWLQSRAPRAGGDVGRALVDELAVAKALADSGSSQMRRALTITEPALRKLADM